MSLAGIDVMWFAGGAAGLLLLLAAFLILIAGSKKKKQKHAKAGATKRKSEDRSTDNKIIAGLGTMDLPVSPAQSYDADPPIALASSKPSEPPALASLDEAPIVHSQGLAVPSGDDRIVGDFGSKSAWVSPGGGAPPAGLAGGAFTLGPLMGVISSESLLVRPGDVYVVDYTVRLIKAPKNGQPARYVVGPMFLDAKGNPLSWGSIEPALTESERHSRVEVTSPPGAERLWLHLGGLWAAADPQPDGLIAYTHATLEVLEASVPAN